MGMFVCQNLGFNRSHVFAKELSPNISDTTALPFILNCIGNETFLAECPTDNGKKTCPIRERSRLACLNGTVEETISVSCSDNSFGVTVDLDRLRMLFPDLVNNDILLGGTCTGRLDGHKLVFDQNFDLCSTRSKEADNQTLMFTNTLVSLHVNPDGIIRHFLWAVDLQCLVSRNESTEISYIPVESNHVHHLGSSSHFIVKINLFSDALFHHPLQDVSTEAIVGSEIFVQVQSPNIVGLRMIVENCYAKPNHGADKQNSFSLIENGCEVDTETHITRYADTETRFFFTAFAFPTGDRIVAVHCDIRYCSTAISSRSTCRHGCHSGPGIIGR
ncbi:pancreatic secretory granule membrane major glycoprotein GP2 [Patella vulgata]|uniref:pancreatic secretory granule membrane major glycoprotein GP2 n=1 Tax=Patella vulgata TaxID=6465 RepID=UPI0024A995F5|nr:pancreatic secretory granule membrane major glycoprotein GP2 [Patella vulgata]